LASEPLPDLFSGHKAMSVVGWKIVLDSKIYSRNEFTSQVDSTPHFHVYNPKISV